MMACTTAMQPMTRRCRSGLTNCAQASEEQVVRPCRWVFGVSPGECHCHTGSRANWEQHQSTPGPVCQPSTCTVSRCSIVHPEHTHFISQVTCLVKPLSPAGSLQKWLALCVCCSACWHVHLPLGQHQVRPSRRQGSAISEQHDADITCRPQADWLRATCCRCENHHTVGPGSPGDHKEAVHPKSDFSSVPQSAAHRTISGNPLQGL